MGYFAKGQAKGGGCVVCAWVLAGVDGIGEIERISFLKHGYRYIARISERIER